jgi:hypothetical protein
LACFWKEGERLGAKILQNPVPILPSSRRYFKGYPTPSQAHGMEEDKPPYPPSISACRKLIGRSLGHGKSKFLDFRRSAISYVLKAFIAQSVLVY